MLLLKFTYELLYRLSPLRCSSGTPLSLGVPIDIGLPSICRPGR
jgi:hypothetical protein